MCEDLGFISRWRIKRETLARLVWIPYLFGYKAGAYPSKITSNICKSAMCGSAIKWIFLLQNNAKDLDLWDC